MNIMPSTKNEEKVILEADTVFLLMKKGFPISRNVRAQWMLEHLDTVISIQCSSFKTREAAELEIVSVLPKNKSGSWSPETCHQYLYKVTSTTSVIFLAHKYRMVFNLDLSPSLATVDIQHGEIVIDEVYMATKHFLESIIRPFTIPGSKRIMQPEIYVTIIAHTPFFTSPAQQVLVQGWLVTLDNVKQLTNFIENQLHILEEKVACVTAVASQQLENLKAENERLVGGLFEENNTCLNKNNNTCVTNTSIISPESSFINMLRYGMLALTLLPEHSCAHMIIVSDGIVGNTDVHVLDSVIQQLRATTIACSFLHVGSTYHPHSADGLVPYQDLLHFIARATLGTYMSFIPYRVDLNETEMNVYHKNFLCWQLYREVCCNVVPDYSNWHSKNLLFYGEKSTQLLQKKQIEDKVTCTLSSLLCCRLREGYLIKRANVRDEVLEICFVLLWKSSVLLEYIVTCPWLTKSLSTSNTIQYTITTEAPYEFLHDITCLSKKPLKSQYRQSVVNRFWATLTSLTEGDSMLAHFSWSPDFGWTWYSVPDTIRSGMPVFYLSAYPSPSTVQLSDAACPQFGQIWQPVVSLNPLQWARWMHTQRVTLILSHDRPLPRHLHQANQSGRFQCVQSRQAAAVLYAMLKNWATFVLVENHTYVQFIYREADKPPVSFSLIRINCKALCVILNIAFAAGTEGVVRHNVVVDLLDRLSKLTLPNRPTEQKEIPSCTIVHKSLEKILIRYERMPTDLNLIVFPDAAQTISTRLTPMLGGTLTTSLSRYLYHNRWLWHVKRPFVQTIPGIVLPRLNITAIARILSTITKMRLAEGFSFTYSAAGIINMVLEVQMQGVGENDTSYPCIIQYILFPPHIMSNTTLERDSASEEDTDEGTADGEISVEDAESSGDFQIISEIWIEPQCGFSQLPVQSTATYMHLLQYHEIPDAIARIDEECINALLTLEYLSLLSQVIPNEKNTEIIYGQVPHHDVKLPKKYNKNIKTNSCTVEESCEGLPTIDDRIYMMHFSFDTLNILPKCQQAELLFSMFADGTIGSDKGQGSANKILMDNFLEHMKQLHNKELLLTSAESQRFTKMLLDRRRVGGPPLPFFSEKERLSSNTEFNSYPRWKCFIKGISTTHVIITILPASEKDVVRLFTSPSYTEEQSASNNSERNGESTIFNMDLNEDDTYSKVTAMDINVADFPSLENNESILYGQSIEDSIINTDTQKRFHDCEESLVIPVYVYDCSLALLIDTLVDKLKISHNKDIYQDHTFRVGQQECKDFIELKSDYNSKPPTPEPKSEDSDNTASDQRSLVEHCKVLSLAHCHCYVVAVYKSLVLQQPLTYNDMEAAVEQCEETLIEINITNYLRSVCRHLSKLSDKNLLGELNPSTCNDVEPLHNLIKEKFERIITVAFRPVPAHPEFYYCSPSWSEHETDLIECQKSDNDDEIENLMFHSINIDGTSRNFSGKGNVTWPGANVNKVPKISRHGSMESVNSDFQRKSIFGREQPLFLQLSCSIRFQSRSGLSSIPVKSLPTCFMEILQKMEDYKDGNIAGLSLADLKITLDIICLNLPKEVLEVSLERYSGLRATSFCSGSPIGSLRTESGSSLENNAKNEFFQEKMSHLPLSQHNAISNLKDEIEWLLQDETATAFLDQPVINENVLNFVANHVSESTDRFSCKVEKVPLYFVFPSDDSKPKFISELKKLQIDKYCIRQEGNLFYFVKNMEKVSDIVPEQSKNERKESKTKDNSTLKNPEQENPQELQQENNSCCTENNPNIHFKSEESYSDSINLIYEDQNIEDKFKESNTSENRFQWLIDLDNRKSSLPNFWLILNVEGDYVSVYFHCRFLEIISPEVNSYWHTQEMLVSQIKSTCRRVNQYLLLQNLHKTSKCSELLETESSEDYNWKSETTSEFSNAVQSRDLIQNFTPGMFRCRVVWKFTFRLHPRLKTGPGRSGLSRGIKALHGVLNRLAVSNRSNMFVYQENNKNVFYLRLHEQISDGKTLQNKLSESDEQLVVSRSNSVVSLSQVKLNDNAAANDTRPRVRSFSEKESNVLNKTEDSIILMVHGISDAGPEVKRDLVQVLQNRLDDAVLEVLSVMLARNPMCKLTPADVHFIQPPKSPESIIRLNVQKHCVLYITALEFYLRQNILQFLYIPKYTDNRPEYHFQDYSQLEGSIKRVSESDIFLCNQSHSSGSIGIACIALAITGEHGEPVKLLENEFAIDSFPETINVEDFKSIVSTSIYDQSSAESPPLIEFKIWKQGRVNLESLLQKLCSAVKHAIWDLVTEYKFLLTPLTEPLTKDAQEISIENKENQTSVKIDALPKIMHDLTIDRFESGEEGKLHSIYCVTLSQWFQFALEIGVPSVKRHEVILNHRHPISTIITELEAIIQGQAPDTSSRSFVLKDRQPFIEKYISNEELLTKLKNNNYSVLENEERKLDLPVYIPCDFSKDVQGTYTKCILIARNFHQWKASFSKTVQPELLIPKDQKLLQKFNPLILESNFVSRQRILLAEVRSDNITLYTYNWSKEKSEKLIKQTTNLGTWLSSRSNFFTNVIMQKLGIFHHRPIFSREHANSQYLQIMDMESLTKFSAVPHNDGKEWIRLNNRTQNIKHNQFSWNEVIGQTMRDVKPNNYFHSNIDPTIKAVCDLQDLRLREKKVKEDLNKLYAMWQNRNAAPNIPISIIALNTFKQYSRLIHFCHTPLLFLPSWRLQSAATRDHSLSAQSSLNAGINVCQQLSQQMQKGQEEQTNLIKWHKELCSLMLSEYKQYLHSLGFSSVQIESPDNSFEEPIQQQSYYLKKSMLGGVLLFEIHLSQPFFIVKLHIIECSRLQTKASSALVNQFMLSFVDACDKIKISMHLHSFTYDFHLRSIHSYIAGTGPLLVQQGYHLIHFLDDFNKYYSKAPNYARNLIYSDVVTIRNLAISGRTLYSYLLSHEKTYNMRVFIMKSDLQDSEESEYVLVSLKSTPLISYCDAQDTKYTDDFDVVLIVSHLGQPPQVEKTEITLKYYLMLTSKRELYPKREVENNKLGKFRTVYSVEKSPSTYTEAVTNTINESSSDLQECKQDSNDKKSDTKLYSATFGSNCNNTGAPTPPPVPNSPLTQNVNPPTVSVNSSSPHLIQIRQESINYLGYYSSHEQLMQQTIMSQANAARMHIMNMIKRGALQCRTHLLWNKLLESKSAMNYNEFSELCSLAHVEPLLNLDPRLRPFINQPISWYQTLSKVLQNKYQEHHKQFNTPDGNITHLLILHPSFFQVFMMLTIDLHASRGDLFAVYCKSEEMINAPCCIEDTYNLIEGFVNACCFNLWMGLYS